MKVKLFLVAVGILFSSIGLGQVQIGQSIDVSMDGGRVFGISMNDAGTRVAFGNPLYDGVRGKVKVYEFNGSSWEQLGSDLIGETAVEFMGFNLELDGTGNRIVVGSDSSMSSDGKVEVFEYDGTQWVQLGEDIVSDITNDAGQFGKDVSISKDGSIIAAGEVGYDSQNGNYGRVAVFEFNGSDWVQLGDAITGLTSESFFGWELDLNADGNRVVASSQVENYIVIYEFNGSSWELVGDIIYGDALTGFGKGVEINGDGTIVAVTAPYDDTNGENTGVTKIYEFNGTDWELQGNIFGLETNSGLWRLDMNSVGNLLYISSEISQGFSVYNYDDNQWLEIGFFAEGDFAAFNETGSRMSMSTVQDEIIVYDLSEILRVTEIDNALNISVSPNPVKNTLFLSRSFSNLNARVYDANGRLLKDKQVVNQIELTSFPSGMYIIKLSDGIDSSIFKVIKE